ncbi:MAG: hypothetical protein MZV70_60225 [Desulfobacterales bacterium]|nr:hypothetical protein [Desulfobacterales bacterium]
MQLKGTQQLTITPVMHYFIQLLADNHLELAETLQNEVEANPMLEIEPVEKTVREDEANDYQKRIERADSSFMTPYEEHGFLQQEPRRHRQEQGPGGPHALQRQPGRPPAGAGRGHLQRATARSRSPARSSTTWTATAT